MVANKKLTLAFIRETARILLGFKKKGFGQGRWNGFGGKVEPGETISQAAARELTEEAGIEAKDLDQVGVIMFEFLGDPQLLEVHVFVASKYSGIPTESDEMRPQWYDLKEIPFSQMWPDDDLWFPYLLNGDKFYGYVTFKGMSTIVQHSFNKVDNISDITIPTGPKSSLSNHAG